MSGSPTTFRAEPGGPLGAGWNDRASLHRRDDDGVFYEFKSLRHGTIAELVRYVMNLPDEQRLNYAIEKSGDHRYEYSEIRALYMRPDFPRA